MITIAASSSPFPSVSCSVGLIIAPASLMPLLTKVSQPERKFMLKSNYIKKGQKEYKVATHLPDCYCSRNFLNGLTSPVLKFTFLHGGRLLSYLPPIWLSSHPAQGGDVGVELVQRVRDGQALRGVAGGLNIVTGIAGHSCCRSLIIALL